jgi:hypothetical protein
MTTANLERVRVEDMDDALKLELGALLNAGNSGEAISNLRSLGFFEVTPQRACGRTSRRDSSAGN